MFPRRNILALTASALLPPFVGPGAHAQAVLKFASPAPATDPAHTALEHFAKQLNTRSGGQIATRVFPGGQLGQHREVVQGLQSGAIELAFFSSTHLVNFAPELGVLDLPYLISRREQVGALLEGEFGRMLLGKLDRIGLTGLCFSEASFRGLMLKKPIKGASDLAGLKIRVPNSPLYVGMFKAMGALPTPIAFGEMYSALQQGVVDGAENSISAYFAYKFHEVAPHFYYSNHVLGPGIFVASTRALEKLPEVQRRLIGSTAVEAGQFHRKIEWEAADDFAAKAKAAGASFNPIDVSPWVQATRPLYKEHEARIGADVMERVASLK